jgi:Replication-relaxation
MRLDQFAAEPECWWPDGHDDVIKPDAYTALVAAGSVWSWWLEVDRATESRDTLRRKLAAYLTFAVGGRPGPDDVVPRVLVTVPDPKRLLFVRDIIDGLPSPADQMLDCELHQNAISYLVSQLR